MRQLLPVPPDRRDLTADDLADLYGDPPSMRLNMIASADGSASAGGKSGALGGPADKRVFAALRSVADAVLVGAGTWRTEGYGPARLADAARARRRAAGRPEVPAIAVITARAQLDWGRPFFTEAEVRPLIVTVAAAPADSVARARQVADVIVAGEHEVDLGQAVGELRARGFAHVLCEGGPHLGAQLAAEGILDELCLTVSPRLVVGDASRILVGPALPTPAALALVHVLEEDGFLFLRYRKAEPHA
jgi:riboflavin biosynthesis pyrimidine reductase